MKAYKIVKVYNGRWFSASSPVSYSLEYKLGEVTRPIIANSKILVFDTLENASAFSNKNTSLYANEYAILECEVGEVVAVNKLCADFILGFVEMFWENPSRFHGAFGAPVGTLGTDWCKPIKVVEL